ncbi:MAG: hypothetical protein ACE5DS_06870, partial [Kiloniellaceae bacterium]
MSNRHLEQSSFLFGANERFIADLYARFLDDPGLVDPSWRGFFRELNEEAHAVLDELRGASWAPAADGFEPVDEANGAPVSVAAVAEAAAVSGEITP